MNNIKLTIPKLKVKELIIEPNESQGHMVSINIGLINNSDRCLGRIRLDSNKPWSDSNIPLTDKMKSLICEIIVEIETNYINDNLIDFTEDYNDNPVK